MPPRFVDGLSAGGLEVSAAAGFVLSLCGGFAAVLPGGSVFVPVFAGGAFGEGDGLTAGLSDWKVGHGTISPVVTSLHTRSVGIDGMNGLPAFGSPEIEPPPGGTYDGAPGGGAPVAHGL